MPVIGLDPSLTGFGWAIHDGEGEGRARCPDKGHWETEAKDLFVGRYIHMRDSVVRLVMETGIRRFGVESPYCGDLYSEGMYGLYLYVAEGLWLARCDVVYFTPMQTKAHARRFLRRPMVPKKWVMKKSDMIEAAKVDTGGKGRWTSDEADAYWAGRTGSRFWDFYDGKITEEDLTPEERHQFAKIHTFTRGRRAGDTIRPGLLYREDDRFFRWSER
jgi:hypothetical protein